MKNTLKYKLLLLIVALGIFSCDDEAFLTEEPADFYTVDNAYTSPTQVDQIIVSLYQHARNMMVADGTYYHILRGRGTDMFDAAAFRPWDSFSNYANLTTETDAYENIYGGFFRMISKANTALYATELENITWDSEEQRQSIIAQAKFFRAFAYRNLGELYGGVPIVDQLYQEAKYDFERSSRIDTYQFAVDDLESILNDLPETTSQGGRVVKGAAQHYLCELYLAMGTEKEEQGQDGQADYNKAVDYASQLIDGSIYSLMTERYGARANEEDKNVYWDLFRINNVNYQDGNTECVWAYQIDYDAYKAEDEWSRLSFPRDYGTVLRQLEGMTGTAEDVGGRGVAFIVPTMYTIKTIWDADFSAGDIRNDSVNIQRNFIYNDPNSELYGQLLTEDVMLSYEVPGFAYPVFWKLSTDQFIGLDEGENRSNLFRDAYAIRLAETYLLRAEAYHRLGQNGLAADDLNTIRERAQCEVLVSAGDVDLNLILDERGRELLGEEYRWNTLLRMGGTVAVDRIRNYNYWPIDNTATLDFNFNLWPIPQSVIDRNKDAVIPQNPGWDTK